MPHGPTDDRFLFLSDVLPTAWQAVEYADVEDGGTLLVVGSGPIGDMAARIALHRGLRVIVVDSVRERLARVHGRGAETIDFTEVDGVGDAVRQLTDGRGADGVIDAVGMEAHGSPVAETAQKALGLLPKKVQEKVMLNFGVDRLAALMSCIDSVRRGGTISISGVYGAPTDPLPMFQLFDKQVQVRMGQANVRRWSDDILVAARAGGGRARRRVVRHAPPAARRRPRGLPQVPRQGGRHGEGGVHAVRLPKPRGGLSEWLVARLADPELDRLGTRGGLVGRRGDLALDAARAVVPRLRGRRRPRRVGPRAARRAP